MSYAQARAPERIAELASRGLDLVTFWRECTEVIAPLVPHHLGPCWFTLDPASLLATSHFQQGLPEIPSDWLAAEYYEDDFNKMADVARSEAGIATLHQATGGDPTRSPRYQEQMAPNGVEQELLAGLRTARGEIWGVLGLYRERGQAQFDEADVDLLSRITPHLAEGARRSLLLGEATNPESSSSPGLLVLDERLQVESATPLLAEWLADLPDGSLDRGVLPTAVAAVAGQALRGSREGHAGDIAFARVLSRSGRWIVLHGATLIADGRRRVAVIIELAHPARITPLLMSAYHLTEREQEITRLVLQGLATVEIAEESHISVNTVQQHLKNIFDKTGVRSRRDLVGKVFFAYYEPRVRDNESRARDGEPLRGGPSHP